MASYCENTVNHAKLFELMCSTTEENANSSTLLHVSKSSAIDKQTVPKLKRKLRCDQLDSVDNDDPNVCAKKQKIEDVNSIFRQHSEGAACVETDLPLTDLSWLINFKVDSLFKEDENQNHQNYNGREDKEVTSPGMCKL
jgi:hypothetical protein